MGYLMVLLFSSLLAAAALFSWNSAILQNKMASNHLAVVQEFMKAEASLNSIQSDLIKNPDLGNLLDTAVKPRQVGTGEEQGTRGASVDYYQIRSDPNLKVKLQAVVALYRDENGIIRETKRKTWEEISD